MLDSKSNLSFEDLMETYLESPSWFNLAQGSKTAYKKPIARLQAIADLHESEFGLSSHANKRSAVARSRRLPSVAQWNASIRSLEVSNNEKNKLYMVLNSIYESAGLGRMKFIALPHTKEDRNPWTRPEIEQLWGTQMPLPMRVAVAFTRFCFETAMRPWVEAKELRWENVGELIEIVGSKRREAGKVSRKVVCNQAARECLDFMEQMVPNYANAGYVWITEKGARVHKDKIRELLRAACKLANVEYHEMYDARRGWITEKLRAGYSHVEVADYVGHSSVNTTREYDRRTMEEKAMIFGLHNT